MHYLRTMYYLRLELDTAQQQGSYVVLPWRQEWTQIASYAALRPHFYRSTPVTRSPSWQSYLRVRSNSAMCTRMVVAVKGCGMNMMSPIQAKRSAQLAEPFPRIQVFQASVRMRHSMPNASCLLSRST
jgi:hypothetical protein